MSGDYAWSTVSAPKSVQLRGIESFEGTAFASGQGGLLMERTGPGEWESVFTTGATGDGRGIIDVSLTDDGGRVWFAGSSGTFGYYDRQQESVVPHSGPYDVTANFKSVSANGETGSESVHAVDDAGQVLRVTMDGEGLAVDGVAVPGDGAGFTEVVDHCGALYATDRAGRLHRSDDGRNWTSKRLAETAIKALSRTDPGLVAIDDGGTVYKHVSLFGEDGRTKKAAPSISSPEELEALEETIIAVGGGGTLLVIDGAGRASEEPIDVGETLYAAEVFDDGTILAAGSSGVVVEGKPQ
jgi:streptogramin lyase